MFLYCCAGHDKMLMYYEKFGKSRTDQMVPQMTVCCQLPSIQLLYFSDLSLSLRGLDTLFVTNIAFTCTNIYLYRTIRYCHVMSGSLNLSLKRQVIGRKS